MTDSQTTSFGDSWLILGVIAGILLASLLIYFIWWFISQLSQIQKGVSSVESFLKVINNKPSHQPPSQTAQKSPDESFRRLSEATDAAKLASSAIKNAAEEIRLARGGLEAALSAINLQQTALDSSRGELDELRVTCPRLQGQISELREELRVSKVSYEDEQRSRDELVRLLEIERLAKSGLENQLSAANEELISKGQHIENAANELSNVKASLAAVESRRDELNAETLILETRLTEMENNLSATQRNSESFSDWVLSVELKGCFPDEIKGVIADKNCHELLSALAVLEDSKSELCEESFVLANVRHLGSLLVYHYKSQGLDAAKREEKLRRWADFVNGKVSGRGQVVVPGLRFPVNAAAMAAPDGIRLISDVHCWLVNNSKGGVYSLAKVS